MRNPIIEELRRIRDENARRHSYDLEAMAQDWVKLEPWMEKKMVTLRNGQLVTASGRRNRRGTRRGHGTKRG